MRSLLASLVLVLCVGFVVGVPGFSRAGGKKPAPAAVAECQSDSDCVLVIDGCCGCNEGGKQRAVPKSASDKYEKKRKATCKQMMCSQMISQDASCSSRAVCQEKVCALGQ